MLTPHLKRGLLVCLIVFGCLPYTLHAQQWAEKMFSATKHDFGTVAQGSKAQHRIIITNLYKEDVHISNVRTTCGCTAAKPSVDSLKSREKAYIQITMDTNRFKNHKNSNVIVTFDAPLYAEVRIPIHAFIRTDIVMNPGSISFNSAEKGKSVKQTMNITYAGRMDWKIKSIKTNNKYVTAKVVETSRQRGQFGRGQVGYQLIVELSKDAPIGSLREQIVLITDDANAPRVPVIVEANVEADITITPPLLSFGKLAMGEKSTRRLVLKGRRPFTITTIECNSNNECFRITLPKEAKRVHVLPLTLSPLQKEGKFSEVFTVTIAGRKDPLTFRANYSVVK
ncbi:hypothetical protein MNBD_PLANCTO02-2040 [hydrothermal vent metagenome]|uniref:DUF1573 domain-containing protein n=1 Tax=hydrothermal vent metagenome TaxID=652676 RepID=A0A3B1DR26_9ZZZZ